MKEQLPTVLPENNLQEPGLAKFGAKKSYYWMAAMLALVLSVSALPIAAQVVSTGPAEGRQITLRQQLTFGLRATTPADFAFIDTVVKAVEQGRLPRTLVDTTFLWSRGRAARRSFRRRLRPIVFFQPALTMRAQQLGIQL